MELVTRCTALVGAAVSALAQIMIEWTDEDIDVEAQDLSLRPREIVFRPATLAGGAPARVSARALADASALELRIHDEEGRLVCRDDHVGPEVSCAFTPPRTGRFTIRIRNLGPATPCVLLRRG